MRNFTHLEQETFDLIVIGGGINGAGVARDAALRGLKTVVIERGDFASGTSSWSTRLVHGGLRYLEYFEVPLVRESLREREVLLRMAPHLVKPLLLTVPIYKGRSRPYWKIQAGMCLYDLLSYDKSVPKHRMLPKDEFQQLFRTMDRENLKGGAQYYDAQAAYAERLCLENIFEAQSAGATVCNYMAATNFDVNGDRITAVHCQDQLSGQPYTLKTHDDTVVINTAGPWVDQVLNLTPDALRSTRKIGGTKGSHIVVKPFPGAPDSALYVEAKTDGRPFFIVPWLGHVLIGTTDLRFEGELDPLKADNDEVDYLLKETNLIIPTANLGRDEVTFTYSGVRPLPYQEGKNPGELTRKHILFDHTKEGVKNLISLIGGKLTTFRHVGEEMVDAAYRKMGRMAPPCPTLTQPLPGCILPTDDRIQAHVEQYGDRVSTATVHHLFTLYGSQGAQVLALVDESPELAELIHPQLPDIKAQIVYGFRSEMAETFVDITRRRTTIAMLENYGLDTLPVLADIAQRYCGWDGERCDRNITAYHQFMAANCIPDYQCNPEPVAV
ncbi:glycerol-3-phosphate dehydrogenase [Spirulina major]|uniref:glycerol-3-phosphate dehydrogenase n=1 Tax=Spirulina major TaxID=270636 RepID=UPI0009336FF7|nr:glycerol-3-phosphate dehydrogenase [Spirulina major]